MRDFNQFLKYCHIGAKGGLFNAFSIRKSE